MNNQNAMEEVSHQTQPLPKNRLFLSNLVVHTKYANYLEDKNKRQNWEECVTVLKDMHKKRYPQLADKIEDAFVNFVLPKKVLPSMRSIQFGGLPIELAPNRIFNCSYTPIDSEFVFAEVMFLLLGGTGVGFSVRKRHIEKLPACVNPQGTRRFMVGDSIEGWADSIRQLVYAFTRGKQLPLFDYRDIRPEGSPIRKTGGKAPGSEKLKKTHQEIEKVLRQAIGRKLTDVECHDIVCHIANCVLAGGVRDAALISLFDKDSDAMIKSKSQFALECAEVIDTYETTDKNGETVDTGWVVKAKLLDSEKGICTAYNADKYGFFTVKVSGKWGDFDKNQIIENLIMPWYVIHPQRARSNNSVALRRGQVSEEEFQDIWKKTKESGSGEPGIYWTNDDDDGTNPCCFTPETRFLTENGYRTMEEMWNAGGNLVLGADDVTKKGTINIINSKGLVEATNVYKTSEGSIIYKVEMSDGSFRNVTKDHNFITKRGKMSTVELETGDLIPINYETSFGNYHNEAYAKLAGWVIGDGSVSKSETNVQRAILRFWNEDIEEVQPMLREECLTLYESDNKSSNQNPQYLGYPMNTDGFDHDATVIYNNVLGRMLFEDGVKVGNKHKVPERIWLGTKKTITSFLQGLFSADGHVETNHGKKCISIRLSSSYIDLLHEVQQLLYQIGIPSSIKKGNDERKVMMNDGKGGKKEYTCKKSYRLIISGLVDCKEFMNNVAFLQQEKNQKALDWFKQYKGSNNTKKRTHIRVKNVEIEGYSDTYCLTEPISNEITVCGTLIGQCEIALKPRQFCNLTTVVVYDVTTQEELNKRARVASFIGTLQAGYTDFHYLREDWKKTTEKEALIGVSQTGVASGTVLNLDLQKASLAVVEENIETAKIIGINPAARTTCMKPEGSGTLAAGVIGSGIHAAHGEHFIRNVRIKKKDAVYSFLKSKMPEFVEDEMTDPKNVAVVSIPIEASKGIITRSESSIDLLERIKKFSVEWILTGHVSGVNTHNVSATVSVRDNEWEDVAKWMWENKDSYNGLSVLPFSGGSYKQAPFQDISKEEYDELVAKFPDDINFDDIVETEANINHAGDNLACAGGSCEI